ncbi:MAG: PfkB family carbohydrate kinase [Opitutaceae bacterium]
MQKNISKANAPQQLDSSIADVAVFGEVLYDCFPDGRRVLGGAPFNVAWGLKGFGQDPLLISAVGDDAGGQAIRDKMSAWGMRTDALNIKSSQATGEVFVTIESDEPSYEICEPRAWDFIDVPDVVPGTLIYHGLLALRNEHSRLTFDLLTKESSIKRFFDVNLRPPYYDLGSLRELIRGVHWLKLNIDELIIVLGDDSITFENSRSYIERLLTEYSVDNVLLTGGIQGALILGECGHGVCMPAPTPSQFVDTVGAGDSFSAFTIHGILTGMPVEDIVEQASHFASKVCGLQGATTDALEFYKI